MSDYEELDGPEVEIPSLLHQHESGELFGACIECGIGLLDGKTDYLIEKAFRRYPGFRISDTVFEFAICMPCMERLYEQHSKESREAIENFFLENNHFMTRGQHLYFLAELSTPPALENWLGGCAITGEPTDDLEEYQVAAICRGGKMLLSIFPYIISGKAMDQLVNLLSNQTIDNLDDFSGRHFGIPPEFDEKPRRVVPVM